MSKGQLYKIEKNNVSNSNNKDDLIQFIVGIIVYAVVLMIADSIFEGIRIAGFGYAIIAALILSFLNSTIKPFLIYLTLPITVVSCGILYPIVNIIILKFCDLIMGSTFEISGIISPFIISIFISILKIWLDNIITKNVGGE